jgi:peptidoglycan-associated lipoprotein
MGVTFLRYKNMQKHLFTLMLALVLSTSLTACKSLRGGDDEDTVVDTSTSSTDVSGTDADLTGDGSTTTTDGNPTPFATDALTTRDTVVGKESTSADYTEEETSTFYTTKGYSIRDRVFFSYDSAELAEEARETLTNQAKWLKENSSINISVEGHADERGTREYNIALGDRRAAAVRNYLIAQGIAGNRIDTTSLGKEQPAVLGSNEKSYAKNRRAVSAKK